jgi:hypothetical protein
MGKNDVRGSVIAATHEQIRTIGCRKGGDHGDQLAVNADVRSLGGSDVRTRDRSSP